MTTCAFSTATLRLIVDASASMAFKSEQALGAKYAYASVIAAALGRIAVVRGDRVALDFIAGEGNVPLPSTGGREAFERLVGHLESGAASGDADEKTLERALAPTARYARRGAAVVVLSDLIDLPAGSSDMLAGLCAGGRAVVVVQVLDPVEQSFPFEGAVALRALEGQTFVETEAEGARAEYLAALESLRNAWEQRLLGRGGRFLLAGTAEEPTEVVRRVLLAIAAAGEGTRGAA